MDLLEVGQPSGSGLIVGMAYFVAELGFFTAYIAGSRHFLISLYLKRGLDYSPASKDMWKTGINL
jgi:hypothetical protein